MLVLSRFNRFNARLTPTLFSYNLWLGIKVRMLQLKFICTPTFTHSKRPPTLLTLNDKEKCNARLNGPSRIASTRQVVLNRKISTWKFVLIEKHRWPFRHPPLQQQLL